MQHASRVRGTHSGFSPGFRYTSRFPEPRLPMGAIGTPGMAGMMHQPLHADQMEQHPAVMEQFLDNMFSFPPCVSLWGDYNGAASAVGLECGSLNTAQKLFKMAQAPPTPAGAVPVSRTRGQQAADIANARDNGQYATPSDDPLLGSLLPLRHGHHDRSPALGSAATKLQGSPSVGSSESEGSPALQASGRGRDQSPPCIAPPTWRQTYVVGGAPTVSMTSGQNNADADAYLGKRGRDEADISRDNRGVTTAGLEGPQVPFPAYGMQQGSMVRSAGQQGHQQAAPPSQVISSVSGQVYGTQPVSTVQQHQGQPQAGPVVAKPRVRARRGQATDPHSIAERLRRERIAERMKALQELVPNANKTDKASMLDEIIDYVKFLQLQVKVLSMSRLGGSGAVPPLVADLAPESASSFTSPNVGRSSTVSGPPSDGIALTERQVARLMEEDMGTAMQYLQSKGLCLMPISLASAISSNGQRPQTVGSAGLVSSSSERQRSEQSGVVSSSGGVAAADQARTTNENRESGVDSKTNMGSAEC